MIHDIKFKIDLIVWKFGNWIINVGDMEWFKIDLIVWKLEAKGQVKDNRAGLK